MTTLNARPETISTPPTEPTVMFTAAMTALEALRAQATAERITNDEHGVIRAMAEALRADCTRRRVGAVIVDVHGRVVITGRNGAPPGAPGCLTAGACPRGRMSKEDVLPGSSYDTGSGACIALHAEANAVMFSDAYARRDGTLYVTDAPCDGCARLLAGSGLARYVYPEATGDPQQPFRVVSREISAVAVGGHY